MNNDYIAPVNHGALSATTTTAYEAAKGGVKGMVKSLFAGTVVGGVVAASIAGIAAIGAGITAVSAAAAGTAGATALTAAGTVIASVATWGAIGAAVGTFAMFIPPVAMAVIGIGTAIGLVKGGSKGLERVSQERAAATMVNAQVDAYRAQAVATGVPVTRLTSHAVMNEAPSRIQAGNDNLQYDGRITGAQLAAAR